MKNLIAALCLLVVFSSCKKGGGVSPAIDEKPKDPPAVTIPTPANGSLSGIALPAAAVKEVKVISLDNANGNFSLTIDSVTGAYSLASLPAGAYNIQVSTGGRYETPDVVRVTVDPGRELKVSAITAVLFEAPITGPAMAPVAAPFYSNVNGDLRQWPFIQGSWSSSSLLLYTPGMGPATPEANFSTEDKYHITIALANFTGPGTYVCEQGSGSRFIYTIYRGLPTSIQDTEIKGGRVVVVITAIDAATKTIEGTFSGTLAARSETSHDAKVFTNGTLKGKYLN